MLELFAGLVDRLLQSINILEQNLSAKCEHSFCSLSLLRSEWPSGHYESC